MGSDEIPRSEERRSALLRGYIRKNGGSVEAAEFEDVSESGCCVRGEHVIGDIVLVTVPTIGTAEAQVRWAIGGRSGLRFLSKRGADPA